MGLRHEQKEKKTWYNDRGGPQKTKCQDELQEREWESSEGSRGPPWTVVVLKMMNK